MPHERLGIKLIVSEQHGIRRFLYPLRTRLPSVYRRSAGKLALADAAGKLIPSHVADSGSDVTCSFALSLAPLESRELFLVRCKPAERVAIPDPLDITQTTDGYLSRQERVAVALDREARLTSVVYDQIEHLAGAAEIALDSRAMMPAADGGDTVPTRTHTPFTGLYAAFERSGIYAFPDAEHSYGTTDVELTCCKSWVWLRHTVSGALTGKTLRFTLPLTVTSPIQTCDFGLGNGAYGKIQAGAIDAVGLEIDLAAAEPARYRIRSLMASGESRTDYAGEVRSLAELLSRLWLHWNEPRKALALAITDIAKGCEKIEITLGADGVIKADFLLGRSVGDPAKFGLCYHFLNDIPPIAAATNPASILLQPKVTVSKLK